MNFLNPLSLAGDTTDPTGGTGEVVGQALGGLLATPEAQPGNAVAYGAPVNVNVGSSPHRSEKVDLMTTGLYVFGALMIAKIIFGKRKRKNVKTKTR